MLLVLATVLSQSVLENGVAAPYYSSMSGAGSYYVSQLSGDSASFDHYLYTANARTDGMLLGVANQYYPKLTLSSNGDLWLAGGLTTYGTIRQNFSGTVFGASAPGDYFAVASDLPSGYDGRHGAFTIINSHELRSGLLIQASRGVPSNPISSSTFVVDFAGGVENAQVQWQTTTLPHCGGGEYVNTETYIGITDGGWGNVGESARLYVVDRHRWCYCVPDAGDNGWLKEKDETDCN